MKNFICVLVVSIMLGSPLCSQPKQGGWEISLSGNLGSVSSTSTYSSAYYTSTSDQESQGFVTLALRPGYFITQGLEIEPEILWTAVEKQAPAFCLTANMAYNFSIPESHITPFVLAGYGTANAIPILQRLYGRETDHFDIKVLNAGAGVKIFVTDGIALRTEYRYQKFSQESTNGSGSYSSTIKHTFNFHNVFVGFSILL
jgi:opacity protein-like surface antigen